MGVRRIAHNRGSCAGLGVCESLAPRFFEVGGDGELVLLQDTAGDSDVAEIDEAIDACPTQSLSWATGAEAAE